jgi:two-component system chemotaxis response regulator CheY
MTALEDAYKTLKVLIVDDEEPMRTLIGRMLERLGVSAVFHADDGARGFAEVLRSRPDVVLCDIHMHPVDGHEFLRLVRESNEDGLRDLPVIFLSGDNLLNTLQRASRRHVDAYLVKPMSREDLKMQLDIIIARVADRRR